MNIRKSILATALISLILVTSSLTAIAGSAKFAKSIVPAEDGTYMVKLRVTAVGSRIYTLKLKDRSASIIDVYAPKGWCIVTDDGMLIARSMKHSISPGKSVELVIYTSTKNVHFDWSAFGMFKQLGKGGTI
ncbi:hypothetical protein DRQ05_01725 [bacterium]|nr:MAG: hypothetical protein DRQ05_01725 [bacterium]